MINSALERTHKELAEEAPILKEKPIIKYELLDENDKPVSVKRPWWRRIFD